MISHNQTLQQFLKEALLYYSFSEIAESYLLIMYSANELTETPECSLFPAHWTTRATETFNDIVLICNGYI